MLSVSIFQGSWKLRRLCVCVSIMKTQKTLCVCARTHACVRLIECILPWSSYKHTKINSITVDEHTHFWGPDKHHIHIYKLSKNKCSCLQVFVWGQVFVFSMSNGLGSLILHATTVCGCCYSIINELHVRFAFNKWYNI